MREAVDVFPVFRIQGDGDSMVWRECGADSFG